MRSRIKPEKGYALIDSFRVGVDVGALGLGVSEQIPQESSLYTLVAVESFCAALAFVVFIHETINLICDHTVYKNKLPKPKHDITQHTTYLCFRLGSILASAIGVTLIGSDLAKGDAQGVATTVGTILVAIGIFGSRALSSSQPKVKVFVNNDMEAKDPSPGNQPDQHPDDRPDKSPDPHPDDQPTSDIEKGQDKGKSLRPA